MSDRVCQHGNLSRGCAYCSGHEVRVAIGTIGTAFGIMAAQALARLAEDSKATATVDDMTAKSGSDHMLREVRRAEIQDLPVPEFRKRPFRKKGRNRRRW